jgi:hypothetical protein
MQGTRPGPAADHARRYDFWRRPWLREGVACWSAAGYTDSFWPRCFTFAGCFRPALLSWRASLCFVGWMADHDPAQTGTSPKSAYIPVKRSAVLAMDKETQGVQIGSDRAQQIASFFRHNA